MTLQCVILAGGLGTRMRPLTDTIPKALVPVLGVPFVDWQLAHLAAQGIDRVVLSVGYRGEMLREHLGDGYRFGVQVTWVDEGCELRGTGGALRLALDEGLLEDDFFVLYGEEQASGTPAGDAMDRLRAFDPHEPGDRGPDRTRETGGPRRPPP